jgi:hypothetical protein
MLRLSLPIEPFWIDLPHGVRVRSKPLTTALDIAAQNRAADALAAARRAALPPDAPQAQREKPPALDAALELGILFQAKVEALAGFLIEAWEGVGAADGAGPAALTPQAAAQLMRHPDLAIAFYAALRRPLDALEAEGNA